MRRELTAQVGADGLLTLRVPLGREGANQTARFVEVAEGAAGPARPFASREEWLRFLDETGRQWQGEFER